MSQPRPWAVDFILRFLGVKIKMVCLCIPGRPPIHRLLVCDTSSPAYTIRQWGPGRNSICDRRAQETAVGKKPLWILDFPSLGPHCVISVLLGTQPEDVCMVRNGG